MTDSYGRTIDYMRVSITDRCNLRCRYCMPHGIKTIPMKEILTFEEIASVVRSGADLGIRKIKVTGGEPLVRRGCSHLIERLKEIPGIEEVTVTTNGVLLYSYLEELKEAGTDGINISLDTLNAKRYKEITGYDSLDTVLRGIQAALKTDIPIKTNTVVQEQMDKEEWLPLVMMAKDVPIDVRFIEMMPVGYGKKLDSGEYESLQAEIRSQFPDMKADMSRHGNGPAEYYKIPGFRGSIGFIAAMHGKFCSSCNRLRLTSTGFLKSCLCYDDGTDLKRILRAKSKIEGFEKNDLPPERKLRQAIENTIREKPKAHCFEEQEQITESGVMASIGG
ncbi:GTP 3',8-cyclase MoaA [Clostridium sp. AM58-1XD]|uniref:GTP 3',8-cyclase MoaA n=1 Tax=Clostridium sp. AM58-1XD TaxID=2292307 RepID=UPI000E4B72D3|nr:GTP 3',8-cyclase MoaA [Clostridium sp. AM58-1XD]RGZ01798.1 GTP 3',8-cyclase MoaA [Clostridium sp. AM58-1XD]